VPLLHTYSLRLCSLHVNLDPYRITYKSGRTRVSGICRNGPRSNSSKLTSCAFVMRAPLLPAAPSWYPGHMSSFMKSLPVLLNRSDVVLEVRDARLPLSSINPNFEAHMAAWKGKERMPSDSVPSPGKQRIVVMNKWDLVPPWGIDVRTAFLIGSVVLNYLLAVCQGLHNPRSNCISSLRFFEKARQHQAAPPSDHLYAVFVHILVVTIIHGKKLSPTLTDLILRQMYLWWGCQMLANQVFSILFALWVFREVRIRDLSL
jgi:hypothetical protein